MAENNAKHGGLWEKIRNLREKHLPYTEKTVKGLVIAAMVMFGWIIIWALVLKLGDEDLLITTYNNLKVLTPEERIMWDIIPFNYRGTEEMIVRQVIDTILNCFVFAPFGIMLCYLFEKKNLLRDGAICLGFSLLIELLQFATMLGNPAPEDLITNTVGCFIGYGVYYLIFKHMSTKSTVILAAVVNIVFGIVTIYSFVTVIGAADVIYGIITRKL